MFRKVSLHFIVIFLDNRQFLFQMPQLWVESLNLRFSLAAIELFLSAAYFQTLAVIYHPTPSIVVWGLYLASGRLLIVNLRNSDLWQIIFYLNVLLASPNLNGSKSLFSATLRSNPLKLMQRCLSLLSVRVNTWTSLQSVMYSSFFVNKNKGLWCLMALWAVTHPQ